jgi:hypothetical protein
MHTPLRLPEMLRFAVASLRQLVSPQGPASLQFLCRVLMHHPDMLWEAFALAAKGSHLQKITAQITAVEHLKRSLAQTIDQLHDELARRAPAGPQRLNAYVREVVAQVRREYGMIHQDFRHDVDDALTTFVRALDTALQTWHLRLPRRFARVSTKG